MGKNISSRTLARNVSKSASDLKAIDIKVLDLSKLCSFTDFFVICSGSSSRHVQSVADRVLADQKKEGYRPLGVEGYEKGDWILVDFGSVVAHVFYPEARQFYNIERLWGDAPRVRFRGVTK